jgi:hypothetical protein
MSDNFQAVTEDDFIEPRKAGTNPVTNKPFTTSEVVEIVLGPKSKAAEIEPSFGKRVLAGAGRSLANKYAGLTGSETAPDFGLGDDLAGRIGGMLPDAIGSALAPARIGPQMLYGALTRAIEPGDPLERAVNAIEGAAWGLLGQASANALVRSTNAATGNMSRAGEVAAAAKRHGLDLSAGDITDSNMLRLMEEKSFASPTKGQVDQIARLMTAKQGDPLSLAVRNAYDAAQKTVADSAKTLDDIIKTQNLSGVVPRKTYAAVRTIATRSPDTLRNVRDPELRQMLEDIANYPAGRIPKLTDFGRLDELRKVLGPIMAKVELQSKSGASNVNIADANRWKQLYKSIMDDMDAWGAAAGNQEALAAHKALSRAFKEQVLPLREHPIAGRVLSDDYTRPEDLVRDVTAARNRSIVNDLYGRLDQDGKNWIDAFRAAKRGTREFRTEGTGWKWERPLALTGAAALPFIPGGMTTVPWAAAALAAEQGVVHGLNSSLGKAILAGSPQAARNPLANAAVYSALRAAAQQTPRAALETLREERP